jgi:hypothetical protein
MSFFKNLSRNQKIVISIGAFFFVAIIIYSVVTLITRIGKVKTIVKYAPYSATVSLNDTQIANNSTVWLTPGDYNLKVEFNEHFESYETKITISEDNNAIAGILEPTDDEGEDYLEKHEREVSDAEGQVGALANQQGAKQKEKYPILNHLPINNSLYSISYEYDENFAPIVNVKADPEYLDVAVEQLKLLDGVNILDLNLVFHTPTEFANYQQNSEEDPAAFIKTAYSLSNKYVINAGKTNGDYYYTSFYINDYDRALDYAHYRVILKKQKDGTWSAAADPQPLFTKLSVKNVPEKILKATNSY